MTFARRFTRLLGLTHGGDAGLAAIARSLGYASEFSFAATFERHHGIAPGAGAPP